MWSLWKSMYWYRSTRKPLDTYMYCGKHCSLCPKGSTYIVVTKDVCRGYITILTTTHIHTQGESRDFFVVSQCLCSISIRRSYNLANTCTMGGQNIASAFTILSKTNAIAAITDIVRQKQFQAWRVLVNIGSGHIPVFVVGEKTCHDDVLWQKGGLGTAYWPKEPERYARSQQTVYNGNQALTTKLGLNPTKNHNIFLTFCFLNNRNGPR